MRRRLSTDHLVLLTLWLLIFSLASQFMIVAPILPQVGAAFAVDDAKLGLLASAYGYALAPLALLSGPFSDRYGRRRMMRLGTLLMTAALACHGVAWSFASLLAARAFAGVAGGVLSGTAVAYVGDHFPAQRRGWANGWVMSGLAVGQIAGLPVGTLMAGRFGFRSPFLFFAVTMGLAGVLVWTVLPAVAVGREEALSWRRAVGHYGDLLRHTRTAAAVGVYVLVFFGMAAYSLYLPAWLLADRGFNHRSLALLFVVGGAANVVAGPWGGILSDRLGRKGTVLGSSLLLAATVTALALVPTGQIWVFLVFFLLSAAGAARSSSFQAWMTELVPGRRRGSLMSLAMASGQLSLAVGAGVAGSVYARAGYLGDAVLAALVTVATALLVAVALPETLRASSRTTQHVGDVQTQSAAQGKQGGEEGGEQQDGGGEEGLPAVDGGGSAVGGQETV